MPNENELAELEKDDGRVEELISQIQSDEYKKPLLTEVARKKHFREKSEKERELRLKAEEALKQKEAELAALKTSPVTPPVQAPQNQNEAREFARLFASGMSDDEVSFIEKLAKSEGKKLTEVAQYPYVQAAIEAMRNKAKSEAGTPPSGGPATPPKAPPQNLGKLPPDQLKEVWRKKLDQQKGVGKQQYT